MSLMASDSPHPKRSGRLGARLTDAPDLAVPALVAGLVHFEGQAALAAGRHGAGV